eukprot:922330-Ditylum_brightwellii.AAC.1
MAKEWCLAQAQYCKDMPNTPSFDTTQWSTKCIKATWSIFVDIWNARNAHLHTEMADTNKNILNLQVRKAFALKHSMFASDRLLFHLDLTKRLMTSPESKRLWLESVKITMHDFKVVHKRTPAQSVITDFF